MTLLKRSARAVLRLPRRDGWHNLAAFTLSQSDQAAWSSLRTKDMNVEGTVARYSSEKYRPQPIDWDMWERDISHKDLVRCSKVFFENQMNVINEIKREQHDKFVADQTRGWDIYKDAVASCEKSVAASEEIVANGARALWISFQNPSVWSLDTNEWLDSDQYWQAFIEKYHVNTQDIMISPDKDPESKEFEKETETAFLTQTNKFNNKGGVTFNFQNMAQLPSWEYYDVYRRAFLEHMVYYLVKTGGDYRFFPEIPPWQWLTDIEDLRYKFTSLAQRRRRAFQMESLSREWALDMLPVDCAHHGDEHVQKLIQSTTQTYEMIAARLMGDFCFLCHPCIPIQSSTALFRALAMDDGKGQLFSLGSDVHALFYKPSTEIELPRPKDAFISMMDHLKMTGRRMNPGYSSLMEIFCDLVDSRGAYWLCAPEETVMEAFMRRLKKDDHSRPIYEAYVSEYKERWCDAEVIKQDQWISRVNEVERNHRMASAVLDQLAFAVNSEVQASAKRESENMLKYHEIEELQPLLKSGSLLAVGDGRLSGTSPHLELDAHTVMDSLRDFDKEKEAALSAVMSTKIASIDSQKK